MHAKQISVELETKSSVILLCQGYDNRLWVIASMYSLFHLLIHSSFQTVVPERLPLLGSPRCSGCSVNEHIRNTAPAFNEQ